MTQETINTGLNGVPICRSDISTTTADENGNPILLYRGRSIYDLVRGPFEGAANLILGDSSSGGEQLEKFDKVLKENRALDKKVVEHLRTYPKNVNRMDLLLTALSYARMYDEDYTNTLWQNSKAANEELITLMKRAGIRMGAKIPTIIAYAHRILCGLEPIPPDNKLPHAANFLHMMGMRAGSEEAKALDTVLTLYLDHTVNNSTFIARVAESARPDPYGPFIAAGVGLKGVLHGGANDMASQMFTEIGKPELAERYVMDKLERGEIVFGFGHRLPQYKKGVESRVIIAESLAREITAKKGLKELMEIYDRLKDIMNSEKIPEKKRRAPNLDLPVAVLFRAINIPVEWNTPLFQASRHFGWVAHMTEQRADKCPLYRPVQENIENK